MITPYLFREATRKATSKGVRTEVAGAAIIKEFTKEVPKKASRALIKEVIREATKEAPASQRVRTMDQAP